VSRRGDVGADVAGGASFVDNGDILLDWRKSAVSDRLIHLHCVLERLTTLDFNFWGGPISKIRSLASHELPILERVTRCLVLD